MAIIKQQRSTIIETIQCLHFGSLDLFVDLTRNLREKNQNTHKNLGFTVNGQY